MGRDILGGSGSSSAVVSQPQKSEKVLEEEKQARWLEF
jgi:hypothetical protein